MSIDQLIWLLPRYRKLWHEHEALREKYALLSSANGAGMPGHANCDGVWQTKFAELEEDYKHLQREYREVIGDALLYRSLKRAIEGIVQK